MKNTLLTLSLLFLAFFSLRAQLQVNPNPWTGTFEGEDEFEHVAYTDMINTTNDTLKVRWEIEVLSAPAEWKFAVCDKNQCYSTFVTTNWAPGTIEIPAVLAAGESGDLDVHVRPGGVAGSCEVKIHLSLIGDPSTILTSAVYNITISGASSVDEAAIQNLRIFPNPSSDYFALTSSKGIQRIELYNIVGRMVRSFDVVEGRKYYIANLPDGMYMAGMIGNNGKVLRTMRISKRSLRP